MQNLTKTTKQAIMAAKNANWDQAANLNQQILEIHSKSIDALNRLALAQIQLEQCDQAKENLKRVLELDPYNKIAEKNLKKIKKNKRSQVSFKQGNFIEEPGKAKNVELVRVADTEILDQVEIGQKCTLDPNSTYISVLTENDEDFLGCLPKDISKRLAKLIRSGNAYRCVVQSCDENRCSVHIKETQVADANRNKNSFALNQADSVEAIDDDEKIVEDIPLDVVNTDTDVEDSEINVNKIKTD